MAIVEDPQAQPKRPGMIMQAAMLIGATLVAAGIGLGAGMLLDSGEAPADDATAPQTAGEQSSLREIGETTNVVYLDPLTTNMAGSTDMWVRLEMGLVFDGAPDPETARLVQEDTLAYLRTIRSHQVEGASGYRHFRADLQERAAIRSEGKVSGIVIRTLLFE